MRPSRHILPRPYHPRVPLTEGQRAVLRKRDGRWHAYEGVHAATLSNKKRMKVYLSALRHVRKLNNDPHWTAQRLA